MNCVRPQGAFYCFPNISAYFGKTAGATQITDPTGSGPYKFNASEFAPGSFASYSKFADYVPRPEQAEFTSGGKIAHFDRMEWPTIPEPATAAAARA